MADDTEQRPSAAVQLADSLTPEDLGAGEFDEWGVRDLKMARALQAFARTGRVALSCKAAGISTKTWYDWKNGSAEFMNVLEAIEEARTDAIEEVAIERAIEKSDSLAIFLLKSRRYKDTKVAGDEDGAITEAKLNAIVNAMGRAVDVIIPNGVIPDGLTGEKIKERIREEWLDIVTRF